MPINIDLTHFKNVMSPHFYPLLYDNHRYIVCKGGAGSSKSHSISEIILFNILKDLNKPYKHRVLALRKTSPAARRSVFELFRHYISEWHIEPLLNVNKTSMTIDFIDGSQILVSGLDDEAKLKSIEGLTSIWLEEALELTKDDFMQCDLRLRGQSEIPYKIYCSFNPVTMHSWIYDEFFTKKKAYTTIHESTYKDNPWLDNIYKEHLEDLVNQDENYYRIYCENQWGQLGNVIYNNWEIVDEYPEVVEEEVMGLDFGFSHPVALTRIGMKKEGIYLKEELYQSGLTNSDLIEKLKIIITNINTRVYADSSLPGNILEIRRAGFNISPADKKPYSVKEGLDFCKRYRLFITKDSPNLIKELQGYSYRTDKLSGIVLEEPIKINDDLCDSFRYGIYSHWANKVNYKIYS
jgi:phage terminase large subunit